MTFAIVTSTASMSTLPTAAAPASTVTVGLGAATFVLSLVAVILTTSTLYWWRKRIIGLIHGNDTFRGVFYIAEPVLAFVLGGLVTAANLFKGETWANPPAHFLLSVPAALAALIGSVGVKVLTSYSKDREKAMIKELNIQNTETEGRFDSIKRQRDHTIQVTNYVRAVVDEKLKRLLDAYRDDTPLTPERYLEALAPREQTQFIINMIRQFFAKDLPPTGRLRVGVYMRESADDPRLFPAYGFDGKSTDCFNRDNQKHMCVDDADGAKSVIVQAYRADEPLTLISSCAEAHRDGHFDYFHSDQASYLKSMVAYKHVWPRGGRKDALIVCLDCDQDGFFGRFISAELKEFFVEMMKRLEYEQIGLMIQARVKIPK